jgi:hypothetical protein
MTPPGAAYSYPWFRTVDDSSLEQGDLLRGFDVAVPVVAVGSGGSELQIELKTFDVVVMTQSCDIENDKVRSLLLCPVFDLWRFVESAKAGRENWGSEQRDKLRQGNLPGYHLISDADQDGQSLPVSVVDFHEVYTAPTILVREFISTAGKRLRLCPPYKEHLAQAFARFFMRVGLPVAISTDKLKPVKS